MLCIYGDPSYPLRPQLIAPFRGAAFTREETEWNKSMSSVRRMDFWRYYELF